MPEKLSFATFNLKNLQLADTPMYHGKTYTQAEADAKIAWTGGVLARLQPDIIAFQELWHRDALTAAFTDANLLNDYDIFADAATGGKIAVALAVKKPIQITEHKWEDNFPDECVLLNRENGTDPNATTYEMMLDIKGFSRPVLQAKVKPAEGPDIEVFVAHLKSKLATELDKVESDDADIKRHSAALGSALSTIRRTAEAAALRVMLSKVMHETDIPVAVMGDLNDSQLGIVTSIITAQPRYRQFLASRVGNRSDRGLYSVATLQEYRSLRDVYYTYVHDGQRESLDHILVSEQFYDHSSNREWSFERMDLINDHLDGELPEVSDHGIAKAVFRRHPTN